VRNPWGKIHEVIFANRNAVSTVLQNPAAFQDYVDLFFAGVGHRAAGSPGIKLDLAETRHAPHDAGHGIALTKYRPVVAVAGAQVHALLRDVRQEAVHPCRVDLSPAEGATKAKGDCHE